MFSFFFFFKKKTAYELRISDWSSDVCSSDLGLALGADEQHAATAGGDVAHGLQGAVQHRHRLLQVDDVNVVAFPEQERLHFRIPAVSLVSEVHASFDQLTHGKGRQGHLSILLR